MNIKEGINSPDSLDTKIKKTKRRAVRHAVTAALCSGLTYGIYTEVKPDLDLLRFERDRIAEKYLPVLEELTPKADRYTRIQTLVKGLVAEGNIYEAERTLRSEKDLAGDNLAVYQKETTKNAFSNEIIEKTKKELLTVKNASLLAAVAISANFILDLSASLFNLVILGFKKRLRNKRNTENNT